MTNREGENMPIVIAPLNVDLTITRISLDEKTKKHLQNLGIVLGEKIAILSSQGGTVVVMVKNSRLALDNHIATSVFVA